MILRLPGGTRVSTASVKRYHLVLMADPRKGRLKSKVTSSSNDAAFLRKKVRPEQVGPGRDYLILDAETGSPVR